ncbi:MAG: tetratricopeptide repeat protein [Planctomycetota bacterium]
MSDVVAGDDSRQDPPRDPSPEAHAETLRPPAAPGDAHTGTSASDSALLRAIAPPLSPEAAAAPPSSRFGKFVRVRKLGQGGMGEVWQAWDIPLGRWVALKFLTGGDETEIARFTQEAHVAGKLSHPNITAVYEVGEAQGRHFISMQYIDGATAAKLPRGDRRLIARLIRDAARGVEEAHRAGVVHRDLKPENLLVRGRRAGGSGVDEPHVFVTDFGLARRTEGVSGLSMSGAIIGTPSYMAPEQSRGERVGPVADVYSLGATLYALLTGEAPFSGASIFELIKALQEQEAPSMRAKFPAIERDLDTIVLKCLEKDPARRYASAADLADDLERFLQGEPIAARPASLVYRVRRNVWKRRAILTVALLGLCGVAATLAAVVPPLIRESRARAAKDREVKLWAALAGTLSEAELLRRAGAAEQAKAKLEEGISTCRAFLAREELPIAHYFLGRIEATLGRNGEARVEFDRALALDPALGEARLARGVLQARELLGETSRARRAELVAHGRHSKFDMDAMVRGRPDLVALVGRAEADLSAPVGQSSYFRESDRELGLALLAFARRHEKDARDLLDRCLQRDPANIEAGVALFQMLEQASEWDEAIRVALSVSQQDRTQTTALATVIYSCHWLVYYNPDVPANDARRKRQIEAAEELKRRGPLDLTGRGVIGFALSDAGDYRGALAEFEAIVAARPEDPDALTQRGTVRLHLGEPAAAIEDFDRSITLQPDNCMSWYNRGSAKRLQGKPREAIADFTQCLVLIPGWDIALTSRGLCHAALGDIDAAIADYTAAIESGPERATPLTNRAAELFQRGHEKEALADLDRAIELRPGYYNAWWGRGEMKWKRQDLEGAEADLTKALEIRPDAVEPHLFRGFSRIELGKADAALEDLEFVLAKNFRPGPAWFGVGNAKIQKKDRTGAMEAFRKATEFDPANNDAWRNLGQALMELLRFSDALEAFSEVIRREPAAFESFASRAFCRQSVKDWKGAEEDYLKALELSPKDWEGRANVELRLKYVRGKLKLKK